MWSDHRDAAPFLPQAPSLPEKELVLQVFLYFLELGNCIEILNFYLENKVRDRISDLFLSNEYLEDKNLVRFIRGE